MGLNSLFEGLLVCNQRECFCGFVCSLSRLKTVIRGTLLQGIRLEKGLVRVKTKILLALLSTCFFIVSNLLFFSFYR